MRVIGIVAEFNPFSNGHSFLISKAKELIGDPRALVLTVMSGDFTQRGLPSIMPKHQRTRAVIKSKRTNPSGADIVIELPFSFACAPSYRFASGAIKLLFATGVVTDIVFGIDSDNIEIVNELTKYDFEGMENFIFELKNNLKEGMSYPAARSKAIIKSLREDFGVEIDEEREKLIATTLHNPNTILALEYINEINKLNKKLNKHVKFHMIKRVSSQHNAVDMSCSMPSATSIRDALYSLKKENKLSPSQVVQSLCGKLPDYSLAVFLENLSQNQCSIPNLDLFVKDAVMLINSLPVSILQNYAYMGDNLASYLKNKCSNLPTMDLTFDNFMALIYTKHFTTGRILRAITSLLIGQTSDYIKIFDSPTAIRVLGFNKDGKYGLKIMRKSARLPIIMNLSDYKEFNDTDNAGIKSEFELNLRASNLYAKYTGLLHNYEWSVIPFMI